MSTAILGGLVLWVAGVGGIVAQSPHTPDERVIGAQREGREAPAAEPGQYQARSARSVWTRTSRAKRWVLDKLAAIHVTPAQALIALGLIGFLYTRGRSRDKISWSLLYGLSIIMVVVGVLGYWLDWPLIAGD